MLASYLLTTENIDRGSSHLRAFRIFAYIIYTYVYMHITCLLQCIANDCTYIEF